MTVNQVVMYFLSFGAALGGIDKLLGNRFGYGEKFEKGFQMLGPVALSMAGIICLAPVLSSLLDLVFTPLCNLLNMDPAIFGTILAIDMGGYQLSVDLARDPRFGLFCGVILSSIFGCTLVYSIPVGLGFLQDHHRPFFTRGILLGLISMPFSIIAACLIQKMDLGYVLWNCLPLFILSIALGIGVIKKPQSMIRIFLAFAKLIRSAAILGLMLAAISHLSGITILKNMMPLQQSMQTVSAICIVMLGSMPLAELIQRMMKVPFRIINAKIGINGAGTTSLLLSFFSATPALALIPQMNPRAQVVISACLVSSINVFGAHFAYANSLAPDTVPALIVAKVVGTLAGGAIALFATRNLKEEPIAS